MKVFQNLTVTDKTNFLDKIIEQNKLSSDWKRNEESEKSISRKVGDKSFCFEYIGSTLNRAKLWVMEKSGHFAVTNIVPQEKTQLDKGEYNSLLQDFIASNLEGISCEVSKDDVTLFDLGGEEVSSKFYSFSQCANKSTGRSHPCDEKRWLEFVFSCLKEGVYIVPEYVRFFLKEDGWDEQSAIDLSLDYEYAYEVMKFTRENL